MSLQASGSFEGWSLEKWAIMTADFDSAVSDLMDAGEALMDPPVRDKGMRFIYQVVYGGEVWNLDFKRSMLKGIFRKQHPDADADAILFHGRHSPLGSAVGLERGEDGRLTREQWACVGESLNRARDALMRIGREIQSMPGVASLAGFGALIIEQAGMDSFRFRLDEFMGHEHPDWEFKGHIFDVPPASEKADSGPGSITS